MRRGVCNRQITVVSDDAAPLGGTMAGLPVHRSLPTGGIVEAHERRGGRSPEYGRLRVRIGFATCDAIWNTSGFAASGSSVAQVRGCWRFFGRERRSGDLVR